MQMISSIKNSLWSPIPLHWLTWMRTVKRHSRNSLESTLVSHQCSIGDSIYTYIAIHSLSEYRLTWILDTLRRTDYTRLERSGETYVDYMGGALYPESLIKVHTDFLNRSVMGNTHSVSNRYVYAPFYCSSTNTDLPLSSTLSFHCANEARAAVLSHFNAPSDYTVVFTANASAALKLVAEAYPFTGGSSLVIGADSHNSVNILFNPL